MLGITGARFVTIGEESNKYRKVKVNPVVSDCSWRYGGS